MRRLLLYAAVCLFASGIAMGQACTSGPSGGTQCPGPLTVTVPTGGTKATAIELTPQATGNLCPSGVAAKDGTLELCSQKTPTATLLVDYGDGKGYQSIAVPGVPGPPGPAGAQGPAGPQGIQGPAGAAGPQGPTGAQGPKGEKGADGAIGPQGAQGPAGVAGPQGMQGDKGDPGVAGQPGPAGETGAQGIPGLTGPQGPPGSSGTMTMPAGCDFQITKLDDISHTGHVLFLNCQ